MAASGAREHPDESRALTGLRGIAALVVVAHHLYLHHGLAPSLAFLQPALRQGYLAVDLFFVLSGFVLSMNYAEWFAGPRPLRNYPRFLVRRLARLWPLHATVLLLVALLGLRLSEHPVTPRLLLANLAMMQAWGASAEINPPAWSISAEFLAYLSFPALALLALRGRVAPWVCAGLVAAGLIACSLAGPPVGPGRRGALDVYFNYSLLPVIRCLAGFTAGMLAWNVVQTPMARALSSHPATPAVALIGIAAMTLGGAPDLLIYPLFPAAVLGLHFARGRWRRLLGAGPLHALGVWSYAIYLLHFALLLGFPQGWAPLPAVLAAYVASTIGLAALAHALIERPGRRGVRAAGEALLSTLSGRSWLVPRTSA